MLSTSRKFVEGDCESVEHFLEGIAFFKSEPEKAKKIIEERHTSEGQRDDEMVNIVYSEFTDAPEPKLYPTMPAIDYVDQEALRQDPEAATINLQSVGISITSKSSTTAGSWTHFIVNRAARGLWGTGGKANVIIREGCTRWRGNPGTSKNNGGLH